MRRARLHPYVVAHALDILIQRCSDMHLYLRHDRRRAKREFLRLMQRVVLDILQQKPGELRTVKKRRILLLVNEALVPPDDLRGLSEDEIEACRTEYNVLSTLSNCGHEVRVLGIGDKIGELRRVIRDWRPEITFNLLEEFSGIVTYDHYVVALLELMRQPYTGCNPRGMMLSRDKVLTKQILAYHRILTPRFHLFPWGKPYREPRSVKFPLIVKSATEDASLGISQASIVHDLERLRERVLFIHEQTQSDALAEQYIEGRELYVGVIGNERLTTLPVWELDFGKLAEVQSGIATSKVKWDRAYQKRHGIRTGAVDGPGAGRGRRACRSWPSACTARCT